MPQVVDAGMRPLERAPDLAAQLQVTAQPARRLAVEPEVQQGLRALAWAAARVGDPLTVEVAIERQSTACLLYTSDAADE